MVVTRRSALTSRFTVTHTQSSQLSIPTPKSNKHTKRRSLLIAKKLAPDIPPSPAINPITCAVDTDSVTNIELTSNDVLIGRLDERNFIHNYIENCINQKHSGSLYVSGAPGTGKTAVVVHEMQSFLSDPKCQVVFINCMHLNSASEFYPRLYNFIGRSIDQFKREPVTHEHVENALEKLAKSKHILLILDEIDQLASRSQDVLYRVFDWPSTLSCCLVIIGIANALDLPERRLPRLLGKSHKPVHLVFRPYKQAELCAILSSKLGGNRSTNSTADSESLAIQLCARKIAASTGDVRTALSICRRATELAAQENKPQSVQPDSPLKGSCTVAQPTLKHIGFALKESQASNVLPSKSVISVNNENIGPKNVSTDLPLHHKLVLLSLYLLRNQSGIREIPFGKLYDTYTFICTDRRFTGLEESELTSVCDLLDSRGYLHYGSTTVGSRSKLGTPARAQTVRLRLDNRSVQDLLSDEVFSALLRLSVPR